MAEVGAVSLGNSKFGLNLYNKIKQDSGKFLNQSVENLFCLKDFAMRHTAFEIGYNSLTAVWIWRWNTIFLQIWLACHLVFNSLFFMFLNFTHFYLSRLSLKTKVLEYINQLFLNF